MKNAARLMALTLMMMPLLAAAQMQSDQKLVTNVPFEFAIGSRTVPAGVWTVRSLSSGSSLVAIQNRDVNVAQIAHITSGETRKAAARCALVFHKYGDRYFLTGMRLEGSKVMYRVPESKAEAELRAQNIVPTEEILLAKLR